jgi:hypothetical protein
MLSAICIDAQTKPLNSRHLLLKSASTNGIGDTARAYQWSVDFRKSSGKDNIHIIAIRAEFQPDTSTLTTGNGRFGMKGDTKEQRFYAQDTVYKFDRLPHDFTYFENQLAALRHYYNKVSRGNLTLTDSIYPNNATDAGYGVPKKMTDYSPGWKRKTETTDQYWDRKTHGLMMFIKDAVKTADSAGVFKNLERREDGKLWHVGIKDTTKAVILIFHAGASYLTDGGLEGAAAADSPSDMIDAFINQEFFKLFKDTLNFDTTAISVNGKQQTITGISVNGNGKKLTIDEVMMCSETSNQDGLNWGIQGILVNQLARQLGIPDLFSTSSGVPAVGAFCIMDFAGYSAGQGFIPPYPSAWTRAFMGWDRPFVVGAGGSYNVKALTSVLDNNNNGNDTTILLIPLNNNEYYLVENRQRNLSDTASRFKYDGNLISAYPFNVNLNSNVKLLSNDVSKVILKTENNDISLPASGVLVWHVDERVIRQRLAYNFVNADSSYRGVRLVEADGINDLGVTFTDAFYQAAFDYGGAEDVFPHKSFRYDKTKTNADVKGFGPYSRPSTRSNDGGHTYLNIEFTTYSGTPRTERTLNFQNDTIVNYSDTYFIVGIGNDYKVPGWPRRAAPESFYDPRNTSSANNDTVPKSFYDPLITEIAVSQSSGNKDTVLALLSESGRFYLYSLNGNNPKSYGSKSIAIGLVGKPGEIADSSRKITYFDSIPGAFTFPTAINGKIYIPSTQNELYIYNSANINDGRTIIVLPVAPSSYVCGIDNQTWAVGLTDGKIVTGNVINDTSHINLKSKSPVCAIAALKDSAKTFAAIQNDGALSIIKNNTASSSTRITKGIAPFTLITGDLDNDGKSEIIVSDSKQGVWVYTRELKLAQGWKEDPNDWANTYYIDPDDPKKTPSRYRYPKNFSAPALADLNRDGSLDIVISGTNGIYALNRKGALLSRWPAYLDNRYWYQRGSVTTSPIVVSAGNNQPLVLFSSPTGERATFNVTKIITADKARGVVTFRRDDGTLDSLWDMSESSIDTILGIGDSLIYPYVLPGGFVDALNSSAARPLESGLGSWKVPQSRWPLSAGAPMATSPLAYRAASDTIHIFAVSSDGAVYRWKLNGILTDSLYWPQNGFDAARSFAYGGPRTGSAEINNANKNEPPITFWNYPNPTSKDDPQTTFKYKFNSKATDVRLDIYTITGRRMDTFKGLSGDFPDWNEHKVNMRKYGHGIYRCRMEAKIDGKKYSKQWKMAVIK